MKTPAQSESKNVPPDWQTLAEQTNYQKSWRYADTIAFAQKLAKASPLIEYKSFGKSGEGRDLPLLIVSNNKIFTLEAARAKGKAIVFIQAGIHSGEIDGKDAGFALLRDIAITKTRADLLKNVVILFVPIYNVDGHELASIYNRINQNGPDEMGFRGTSTNLNLNRDYMKADAPETRAWLALWNEWKPDFFIDCHVTDGADFRYNVTYEYAHFDEVSPLLKNWMDTHFDGNIVPKVEAEGNLLTHYVEFAGREVTGGVATFIATPRFATGYTPLRNRIGLLIETHSYKPYKSRVRGTYDILRYTLEEINQNQASLFEANRKADGETIERGKTYDRNRKFPLRLEITKNSTPFAFKGTEYKVEDSDISGAKRIIYGTKPLNIMIPQYDEAKVTASVAPPLYYIIPPQWQEVIAVLQAHGIEFQRIGRPLTIEVESYRLTEPKWSPVSFEGHNTMSYKTVPIKEMRTFPANSVLVPLDQAAANVAIHLLEPDSPDSFMYWGFFSAIFEQKEYGEGYVVEKLAREMLAKNPELKKEFEEKLKDENFAKNPRARLNFFYERSPYFDKRIGLYPVGRITANLDKQILK
ncbi:MAG: M14 family metallopeptidase [Acidobacteria bacterium]|jgi:murein tripeptide amidase MpaA|nr:M14 family metallopeptidase [Acidobacteriota bacterium]